MSIFLQLDPDRPKGHHVEATVELSTGPGERWAPTVAADMIGRVIRVVSDAGPVLGEVVKAEVDEYGLMVLTVAVDLPRYDAARGPDHLDPSGDTLRSVDS